MEGEWKRDASSEEGNLWQAYPAATVQTVRIVSTSDDEENSGEMQSELSRRELLHTYKQL